MAFGGIEPSEHHFRLNVSMFLKTNFIFAFKNMCTGGESCIDIAFNRVVMRRDVIPSFRMNKPRIGF